MPQYWYLPNRPSWLWVCGVLLLVFIPISVRHDRNWKRMLAEYADARRQAGAAAEEWPRPDLAFLMGLQLWLVSLVTAMLAVTTAVAVWAAALWPFRPPGFDLPVNLYDLPWLWSFVVAGTAAVIAGATLVFAIWRSPWWPVARKMRRAIYADPAQRQHIIAEALSVDPEVGSRSGQT